MRRIDLNVPSLVVVCGLVHAGLHLSYGAWVRYFNLLSCVHKYTPRVVHYALGKNFSLANG